VKPNPIVLVRFWPSSRFWHVPQHQERLKRKTNSTHRLALHGSEEKASGSLRVHLDPRSLSDIYNCQVPLRVRTWLEVPLWPPQQRPFVKTLASELDTAWQGSSIHGVRYAVRLSLHSKCVNTPISVGVIMNSGSYIFISILTIRHSNLDSYEEITTCESCS